MLTQQHHIFSKTGTEWAYTQKVWGRTWAVHTQCTWIQSLYFYMSQTLWWCHGESANWTIWRVNQARSVEGALAKLPRATRSRPNQGEFPFSSFIQIVAAASRPAKEIRFIGTGQCPYSIGEFNPIHGAVYFNLIGKYILSAHYTRFCILFHVFFPIYPTCGSRRLHFHPFFSRLFFCVAELMLMMIAFITIKSSLVPLIEGLCAQIYFRFKISVVCSHLLLFFFVKEKTC